MNSVFVNATVVFQGVYRYLWMSGDAPSALEAVSYIGQTFGAGAALTAALYLLRKACLIMAWKSGGVSHAELVNNLRSKS